MLHECGEKALVGGGFNADAEQNEGQMRIAVWGVRGLCGQAEKQRQIGDGALFDLAVVESEEMREVARRGGILQAKFRDRPGEGAREAGRLGNGGEIRQLIRCCGGVNDARGKGFDTETGDRSERQTAHGLSGKMRGQLRKSECVNALAAGWKSACGQFIRGYAGGGDNQDFRVPGLIREKCGSAVEERSVGAGVK
ncbi:MAG TPA: hypothetical protein VK708_12745 [Bryobacteraceae bacterium]|nr:hypothetical protein [Bryobacteraceae bacterium]